jgi:hypothetical protein
LYIRCFAVLYILHASYNVQLMESGQPGGIGTPARLLVVEGHRGEKERAQTLHPNMEALGVPEVQIPSKLVTPILVQVSAGILNRLKKCLEGYF